MSNHGPVFFDDIADDLGSEFEWLRAATNRAAQIFAEQALKPSVVELHVDHARPLVEWLRGIGFVNVLDGELEMALPGHRMVRVLFTWPDANSVSLLSLERARPARVVVRRTRGKPDPTPVNPWNGNDPEVP